MNDASRLPARTRPGYDPDTKPGCIRNALLFIAAACLIGRWIR